MSVCYTGSQYSHCKSRKKASNGQEFQIQTTAYVMGASHVPKGYREYRSACFCKAPQAGECGAEKLCLQKKQASSILVYVSAIEHK